MKIEVKNIEGSTTGRSVELPDAIFGIEPNEHAVYLAVKQYNANQRQGTAKAKERGEIAGSTRKIKRQKGTGTARAGSIKNPLFRGGGRVFGPRPRTYNVRLNKKVRKLARYSALSSKAANGDIIVVEDFTFENPKTKEFLNILKNLDVQNDKILLVTSDMEQNVLLSARNVKRTGIIRAQDLNTFDVLNTKKLIIAESAVEKIQ